MVAKKGKKTTESINSRLQLVIKSGEGLVLGMLWRDAGRRAWGSGAFYQRSREGARAAAFSHFAPRPVDGCRERRLSLFMFH
jgi:hypothetical protein